MRSRRKTIMMSFGLDAANQLNPYVRQLVSGLQDHVDVRGFSWRGLLTGPIDVLHVHWPEQMLRGRNWVTRAVKSLLFAGFMVSARPRHIRIVRTVHNSSPHETGGFLERALTRLLDAAASTHILLHEGPEPNGHQCVILHGHYRDHYAAFRSGATSVPGRILFFGLIRAYKGIDTLLDAFVDAKRQGLLPNATLRIVGGGVDRQFVTRIEELVAEGEDVSASLQFVSDEDLVAEIEAAEVVVLPYRRMENSGALLAALSLERPVIAPDNDMTRQLADEVGRGWVYRYDGRLNGGVLTALIEAASAEAPSQEPDLSGRDWNDAIAAHLAAYGVSKTTSRR